MIIKEDKYEISKVLRFRALLNLNSYGFICVGITPLDTPDNLYAANWYPFTDDEIKEIIKDLQELLERKQNEKM